MTSFKHILTWCYRRYKLSSCLLLTVVSVTFLLEIAYFNSRKEKIIVGGDNGISLLQSNRTRFDGEKLIHFDLKGAPPKLAYILRLLPLVKNLGASGIIMEYEDMFPYHSELEGITALNAYTRSDVAAIIETARRENLSVIPLVPTLSHLEFVLKLEQYKELREVAETPQILCPSRAKGLSLIKKMIDQILEVHYTSKYLHIGCDEADYIAVCKKCQEVQKKNKWRKDTIYFDHVQRVAQHVVSTYPGVRPIVWADKFVQKKGEITPQLVDLVDVMLYNYSPKKKNYPNETQMNDFVKSFKNVWIANAFKGSTGSTKIVTNIGYHLKNTEGWMKFVEKWKTRINFKGIAVTGWQRYNHFNALCELLPVAIPSLALNLQYLNRSGIDHKVIKDFLNCTENVPVELYQIQDFHKLKRLKCDFPGFEIYFKIHFYFNSLKLFKYDLDELRDPDFGFYNVNDLDPTFVLRLKKGKYEKHLTKLNQIENELKVVLARVYDQHTVTEWIATHVMPVRMILEAAINMINKLRSVRVWPRRPMINGTLQGKKFFDSICSSNETRGCTFFSIHI